MNADDFDDVNAALKELANTTTVNDKDSKSKFTAKIDEGLISGPASAELELNAKDGSLSFDEKMFSKVPLQPLWTACVILLV